VEIVTVLATESCYPDATQNIAADKPPDARDGDPPTPTIENSAIFTVNSVSLKDQLLKLKHHTLNKMRWLQLVFITLSMAAAETTNKIVLAACIFSIDAGIMLDLAAGGNLTGMACFGFTCLVFLAATAHFTCQVEDMERIAAKYHSADEASKSRLQHCQSRRLASNFRMKNSLFLL
jgi:hypothetical protein